MTPDEAQKICPDFTPHRHPETGKLTCRHKDQELCTLPKYFVCELVMARNAKRVREQRAEGVVALSPSRVSTLDKCARQYGLSYVHRVHGPRPVAFDLGDAFTVARAKIDSGLPWEIPKDLHDHDRARLEAVLAYYVAHPPYPVQSVGCEIEVAFEHRGTHFHGYLDALTSDGTTIREWKYAQMKYTKLEVIRQAAVYLRGMPKATRFERWRFPKPAHRPGKSETLQSFSERVKKDLLSRDPADVYDVLVLERSDVPVDAILRQMEQKFRALPVLKEQHFPPSYGWDCPMCEYRTACEAHPGFTTEEIAGVFRAQQFEDTTQSNEVTGP